jgi:NAD(P)-dependent dehydrogenase (short-subunit alcohol dehydrogenase family)
MALEGKRALITGSSRGIGRGIALKLAECGVAVAVHYHKDESAAADTLAHVRERGADGCAVRADVSQPEDLGRMFGEVRDALGGLDIFVANARPDLPTFYRSPMELALDALARGPGHPGAGLPAGCPRGGPPHA